MMCTTPQTHTARKQHRCSLCGTPIDPGTQYERWRFFDGRDAGTVRVHRSCRAAWNTLNTDDDEWVGWPLVEFDRDELESVDVGDDLRDEWAMVVRRLRGEP